MSQKTPAKKKASKTIKKTASKTVKKKAKVPSRAYTQCQINKRAAELSGWQNVKKLPYSPVYAGMRPKSKSSIAFVIPDYCNDLNECDKLFHLLNTVEKEVYVELLIDGCPRPLNLSDLIHASPTSRVQAFIKVKELQLDLDC